MGKNLYFSVSPLSPPPIAAAWTGRGWLGEERGKTRLEVKNRAEEEEDPVCSWYG